MARRPRLLLPTPPRAPLDAIAAALPAALATGTVASVRLDRPGAEEAELRRAADALREPCHAADVALLIAGHPKLVGPLGLDGVEVEYRAAPLRKLREALGKDTILGVACSASRHDAMTAAEAGADYVRVSPLVAGALGAAEPAPPEFFEWWSEIIETPILAEGGLTEALAREIGPFADFAAPDPSIWDGDLAAALVRLAEALEADDAEAEG